MFLEQENWVQLLRPRSAQLKFKLPYHGPSTYSYLKGDVYTQLFGKQSTSEVRLWVDAPANENTTYPRYLYNRQEHEQSLYHHNAVTRTQHMDASNRVRVSFDQHAAHDIFNTWKNRASEDVTLSGISDAQSRHQWIAGRIKELDNAFDRALGLRISHELRPYLFVENPDIDLSLSSGGIMQMAIPKTDARRMWKRNTTSRRNKRNRRDAADARGGASLSTAAAAATPPAKTRGQNVEGMNACDDNEQEEGEI